GSRRRRSPRLAQARSIRSRPTTAPTTGRAIAASRSPCSAVPTKAHPHSRLLSRSGDSLRWHRRQRLPPKGLADLVRDLLGEPGPLDWHDEEPGAAVVAAAGRRGPELPLAGREERYEPPVGAARRVSVRAFVLREALQAAAVGRDDVGAGAHAHGVNDQKALRRVAEHRRARHEARRRDGLFTDEDS